MEKCPKCGCTDIDTGEIDIPGELFGYKSDNVDTILTRFIPSTVSSGG